MTATKVPARATIRGLLFDSTAIESVSKSLRENEQVRSALGGIARLSTAGSNAVCDEIANVSAGLAELDVFDLIVAGVKKHGELSEAARRSVLPPKTDELVQLAQHRIVSKHEPSVELQVDGKTVGSLDFGLKINFLIYALTATVSDGDLVRLHSGDVHVSAKLSWEDLTLFERETDLEIQSVIALTGIPLITNAERIAAGG